VELDDVIPEDVLAPPLPLLLVVVLVVSSPQPSHTKGETNRGSAKPKEKAECRYIG
jgi:hypothetical protein